MSPWEGKKVGTEFVCRLLPQRVTEFLKSGTEKADVV
jgi:hypothetical protein